MIKLKNSDVYEITAVRWGDRNEGEGGYFIKDHVGVVEINKLVVVDTEEPDTPISLNPNHQFFGFCPDENHVCVSSLSFYDEGFDEVILKHLIDEVGIKTALEFIEL